MKKIILVVIVLAAVLAVNDVMAQTTDTSSLSISANVVASCRIMSVTNLDFGTYDPTITANDDDGVGDFTFRCTRGTAYDLYITDASVLSRN